MLKCILKSLNIAVCCLIEDTVKPKGILMVIRADRLYGSSTNHAPVVLGPAESATCNVVLRIV